MQPGNNKTWVSIFNYLADIHLTSCFINIHAKKVFFAIIYGFYYIIFILGLKSVS